MPQSIYFIIPSIYKGLQRFNTTFLPSFIQHLLHIDYQHTRDIIMLEYEISVSRETLSLFTK